jgi:hypothetical protein
MGARQERKQAATEKKATLVAAIIKFAEEQRDVKPPPSTEGWQRKMDRHCMGLATPQDRQLVREAIMLARSRLHGIEGEVIEAERLRRELEKAHKAREDLKR